MSLGCDNLLWNTYLHAKDYFKELVLETIGLPTMWKIFFSFILPSPPEEEERETKKFFFSSAKEKEIVFLSFSPLRISPRKRRRGREKGKKVSFPLCEKKRKIEGYLSENNARRRHHSSNNNNNNNNHSKAATTRTGARCRNSSGVPSHTRKELVLCQLQIPQRRRKKKSSNELKIVKK